MAGRNVKRGLVYFRLDCDIMQDRKIKRLFRRFGSDGLAFYIVLLCEIYRDRGYYINVDADLLPDVADTCDIEDERAEAILAECIALGLFSRDLYERSHILTSNGIQARYLDIMAILRRKGGIDSALSLISSEEIGKGSETFPESSEVPGANAHSAAILPKDDEITRISSDNRIVKKSKVNDTKHKDIDTHTGELRKGVEGETSPTGEAASVPLPEWDTLRDRRAAEIFGRSWHELARHEQMYLWAAHYYPLMLQFSRPLTPQNCESILARVPNYIDIDRIFESISNRKNIIAEKVSAIATFNAFARMDVILRGKQKI